MKHEMKNMVKKSAKIAGVTCVAAGAVALVASGAALKAITEGGKYLQDTLQKILNDTDTTAADAKTSEVKASEIKTADVPTDEVPEKETVFSEN